MNQQSGSRRFVLVDPVTGAAVASIDDEMFDLLSQSGAADLHFRPEMHLPNAELAGAVGRGVVPQGSQLRGGAGLAALPAPTFRPLNGAPQNSRGQTSTLTPTNNVFGPAIQLVSNSIVETPKQPGNDAELITVSLGVEFAGEPAGFVPPAAEQVVIQALVEWGMGGASFNATIDWIGGLVFSVPGSYVRIGGIVQYIPGAGLPPPVNLSAAYAYGSVPSNQANPRLTVQGALAGLAAGATRTVSVPRFATFLSVAPGRGAGGLPGADLQIEFETTGGVPIACYEYNDPSNKGRQDRAFPVPNGGWQVSITNLTASALAGGSLIWNLSL